MKRLVALCTVVTLVLLAAFAWMMLPATAATIPTTAPTTAAKMVAFPGEVDTAALTPAAIEAPAPTFVAIAVRNAHPATYSARTEAMTAKKADLGNVPATKTDTRGEILAMKKVGATKYTRALAPFA